MTQEVNLAPKERKTVVFTPDTHKALELKSPRLWWPNNYGRQELYTMDVVVAEKGVPSDSKKVRFGVRELSYELEVCFPMILSAGWNIVRRLWGRANLSLII